MENLNALLKLLESVVLTPVFNEAEKKEEIEKKLHNSGISNEEIYSIYNWRNGNRYNFGLKNTEFSSFGYILPLQEALDIYNKKDFLEFKKKELFPFMSDYSGDYLLINSTKSGQPIHIYSPALFIVDPQKIFENLSSFCNAVFECYRQGAYKIIGDELEIDMDLEEKILIEQDNMYSNWI